MKQRSPWSVSVVSGCTHRQWGLAGPSPPCAAVSVDGWGLCGSYACSQPSSDTVHVAFGAKGWNQLALCSPALTTIIQWGAGIAQWFRARGSWFGCYMAGATWNCCRLGPRSVYTIQPCTCLLCHFIRSLVFMLYVCLAGSSPRRSGVKSFFSVVNFLCWLLFRYLFHLRVTAIARKISRSFCQMCRWQVTARRMCVCVCVCVCVPSVEVTRWTAAWLNGVHRTPTM